MSPFLKFYDHFAHRRWQLLILWIGLLVVSGILAMRIQLKEDIGDFLTSDNLSARYSSVYQSISEQNRIVIVTSAPDVNEEARMDSITSAMSDFESVLHQVDTSGIIQDLQMQTDESVVAEMMDFMNTNAPLLMTDDDFHRADSLLSSPDYIAHALEDNHQMLLLPSSGVLASTIQQDPLHLFSPILARLQVLRDNVSYVVEDGFIFTPDHQAGIGFLVSPYGSSESGNNRHLNNLLEQTFEQLKAHHPSVRVSAIGGPLIAVSNADRIRTDGIIAGILSIILISMILWLVFRRVGDIFWMVVSIATGYAIAIAIMGFYHSQLSVIVLGTGSVLIGIAANYPLHFLDHLRHEPDRRKALADMVPPLLTGNITTVSAFACLAWMDAEAMRDLGIMGALVLFCTILFVLLFLPVLIGHRHTDSTVHVAKDLLSYLPLHRFPRLTAWTRSGWFFLVMTVITCVLCWFSFQTTFDTNLQHINYMTPDQRDNVELLGIGLESSSASGILAVAEATEMDSALYQAEQMADSFRHEGLTVKGLQHIVPSTSSQRHSIALWQELMNRHGTQIRQSLVAEGQRYGFSAHAFDAFLALIETPLSPKPFEHFAPLTDLVGAQYILPSEGKTPNRVVNYVSSEKTMTATDKDSWRDRLSRQGFLFDSSDVQRTLATTLSDDFNYIGFVCGFVVFFFLWLSFGSIELSLLSFLPLAVGWIWILGIMQLLGIQFNIVNIILATFIFGQGDDYTIFITDGLVYEHTYGRPILRSYKNSVALSALIMFIGIGSLIFARHPAMRSLAEVVIVGMFTVVLMAFYLPPVVFRWITREGGKLREVPLTLERIAFTVLASVFYLVVASVYQIFAFLWSHLGRYTESKKLFFHRTLCRISRFCIEHVPGTTWSVSNPHGEKLERPAIIVCNHQSQLDLVAVLSIAPKAVILTKEWVWKNPLYSLILRAAEFYPVSEGMDNIHDKVADLLSRGYSVITFPEGTRSKDREIHRFHQGAFHMAKEYHVDILPIFLTGLGDVLPKDELAFRRGKMHMEIGKRMAPEEFESMETRTLTHMFRHYFVDHYAELRREQTTTASVVPYVRYQYLYKVRSVTHEAKRRLNEILAHSNEIDHWSGGSEYIINNCGQGESAFVFALVHPDVQVIASDPDPEKIDVARHINIHCPNLTFEVQSK